MTNDNDWYASIDILKKAYIHLYFFGDDLFWLCSNIFL